MEQLNLKHLFNGELTPLSLGKMSISAALYTAYHLQNDESFTMITFVIGKNRFSTINILGVPVFFNHDVETNDLHLIKDIESELVDVTEETDHTCEVFISKEVVEFNKAIDDISATINKPDIFEDFFEQVIDDYKQYNKEIEIEYTMADAEEEFLEDEEVQFKNIDSFDGNTELHLDVEIPEVSELLDDVIDIDEEISELKEMAQNMLEEAMYITEHGYRPEDDEYYNVDDDYPYYAAKEKDLYWDTTIEEDEEFGLDNLTYQKESIDYVDKEVSKMDNEKVDKTPSKEFEERMDNMLEFMLSQSSAGHEPVYKFQYSKQGEQSNYEDSEGRFLTPNADLNTKFDADNHIIVLKVTRETDDGKETTFEESELMSGFTMGEVIKEVKQNNKYLKGATAELDSMKTKGGKTIWEARRNYK